MRSSSQQPGAEGGALNICQGSFYEEGRRKGGGGGKSISISGDVIEKAAVNFSSISGTNLPGSSISSKIQTKNLSRFHAVGVSVISHPSNPFCPTSHMNVRIFFVLGKNNKIKDWWIGGGFDLTPYFSTNKENAFWHNQAKAMLEKFNKNYYKKFAKECDEYFYLPHRNEKRGIGGVFFDQLQHGDIENSLKLIQEVANCFIGSYLDIVNNTKNKSLTDYFSAGKNTKWYIAMFSIVATETSVLTFVSIPGLAYRDNWFFLQLSLGYIVGRVLVSKILLPLYFSNNVTSIYELIGKRYNANLQKLTSISFCLCLRIL
mgnify:CR=1 FL=1